MSQYAFPPPVFQLRLLGAAFLGCLASSLSTHALLAQSTFGAILGTARDVSGALVAGA